MAGIDNSKLMGSLTIAEGGLLLSLDHLQQRRKRRQCVRPWIRTIDSKVAHYLIISDLRLTDKCKMGHFSKFLLTIILRDKSADTNMAVG